MIGSSAPIHLKQDNPERSKRVDPSGRRRRLASRIRGAHVPQVKHLRLEKQRAEADLRISEARLRRLTEDAQDIIYLYRLIPTRSLEYINPVVTDVTGYTPSELYAQPDLLFSLIHEEDEPLLQQLFAARGTPTLSVTLRLVRKDGSICWIEQRVTQIRDQEGKLEVLEGIVRDITGRQRAETECLNAEQLRRELEKEKERNALRQRLISMVDHDVRTSLTFIRTSGDILSRYFERISPEKRLKYIRDMRAEIDDMIHLLDTLLMADRARSGELEPDLAPLDVVPFCRAILEQMQRADEARHQFVFISQGSIDGFMTDEYLLRRILHNLLSNAIKYSPEGSEILLEVCAQNKEVLVCVSDQGIGIPATDQGRLFEWFHRASNTGKIAGTGLGLAIVKSAVDALGGSITLSSQEGQGTTFSVHLPEADQPHLPALPRKGLPLSEFGEQEIE